MDEWMPWVAGVVIVVSALLIVIGKTVAKKQAGRIVYAGGSDALRPTAEGWTLGVIARYQMQMGLPVDRYRPSWLRRDGLRMVLHRDWNVSSAAKLRETLQWLDAEGHRRAFSEENQEPQENFLAWDYGRIVWLAWAGLHTGRLQPEETKAWLVRAASVMQPLYRDWGGYGASYLRGLACWSAKVRASGEPGLTQTSFETLLNDPQSPWKRVPWHTPVS